MSNVGLLKLKQFTVSSWRPFILSYVVRTHPKEFDIFNNYILVLYLKLKYFVFNKTVPSLLDNNNSLLFVTMEIKFGQFYKLNFYFTKLYYRF